MRIWFCAAFAALAAPCFADTLLLTTGEKLIGKILAEEPASVVFESESLGKVSVPRDRIQRLEKGEVTAAPAEGAQQPAAPESQPGETVAQTAPPVASEKKREDLFRMYWDQGLRYQFFQPITVPVPFTQGERTIGEDIRISGQAGLKLSLDAAAFHSPDGEQNVPDGTAMRQFALYASGQFGKSAEPTLFKLQFGAVSNDFYMSEGWVRWQGIDYVHNVQVGYETVPQLLDNIDPFQSLPLMEESSMALAFSPGNRLGVEAFRTFENQRLFLSVGVYSVGSDPGLEGGSVTQTLLYPVVRVTGLPIYSDRGTNNVTLMHLGLSVGYQFASGSQFEFKARPESFVAPFLVDTGKFEADQASLFGLEAIYMKGPFTLMSEVAATHLTGESQEHTFWGAYISASYFLTGEQRGYDKRKAAVVGTLPPKRDFSLKDPTGGAWEFAARVSYVDLNSVTVSGGRMGIGMLGLNWYWNRYLRWQLNAGYANVIDGPTPGNLYILQGRLQMTF